jgi:hypothetical protein
MYLAGGGYLGKLWHLGLVRGGYPEGFFLTDAGRKALEQAAA